MTSTLAIPLIAGLMPGLPLDAAVEAQLADRPPSLDGVETFSAPLNEGNALIGIRPGGWTARDSIGQHFFVSMADMRWRIGVVYRRSDEKRFWHARDTLADGDRPRNLP